MAFLWVLVGSLMALAVTMEHGHACAPTDFYVDPDYAGGNGTPDGSAARPWARLHEQDPAAWAAINAALSQGAVTVYFSALTADGTASQPMPASVLVARTDTSANPLTLDGMSYYNTNDATPSAGTWVAHPFPPRWPDRPRGMRLQILDNNDSTVLGWRDAVGKQDHITLRGFEVSGSSSRVRWGGSHTILEYVWSHDVTAIGAQVTFQKAWAAAGTVCEDHGTSTHITVRYNVIERGYGEALYMGNNYQPSIAGPCTGRNGHSHLLIHDNLIDQPGANGQEGDGIDLKAGWTYFTIRHNRITNMATLPYHGAAIRMVGVYGGVESHGVVEGNIVRGGDVPLITLGAQKGVVVRNNVVSQVVNTSANPTAGQAGISMTAPAGMSPPQQITLYNNTVYDIAGPCIAVLAHTGTVVQNNLVARCSQTATAASPIVLPTGTNGDYNVIGDDNASGPNHGSHTVFVPTSAGFFVDADAGDFQLAAGSAALDAGADLSATGFATDLRGQARPDGGAWDVGAYEAAPL